MWEYNYSASSDELYHYGVKGQKWGVRRYQNKDGALRKSNVLSLSKKVKEVHKLVDDAERYQGQANAALQASKGHKTLSIKARKAGDNVNEQIHERKSKQLLSESEQYEKKAQKAVGDFLKAKMSALIDSSKIENGTKYVKSLAGLNIKQDNIDKYEKRYKHDKRYAEGYNAEHQHVRDIIAKSK